LTVEGLHLSHVVVIKLSRSRASAAPPPVELEHEHGKEDDPQSGQPDRRKCPEKQSPRETDAEAEGD
jgi:hypothetical protein